jgi:hypothetical protein
MTGTVPAGTPGKPVTAEGKAAVDYSETAQVRINISAFHAGTEERRPVNDILTLGELGYVHSGSAPPAAPSLTKAMSPGEVQAALATYAAEVQEWTEENGDPASKIFELVYQHIVTKHDIKPEDAQDFVLKRDALSVSWYDAFEGWWQATGSAHWG